MLQIRLSFVGRVHNYWNKNTNMTNNFNASLSFNKRQIDFTNNSNRQHINRNATNSPEETEHKKHHPFERAVNKSDKITTKIQTPNSELSAEGSLSHSCKSSEGLKMKQKQAVFVSDKTDSPNRPQASSPLSGNITPSPPKKQANFKATLKNIILSKSPLTDSNITKQQNQSVPINKNDSTRENLQPKSIEEQNEKLRQQNTCLKNQLNQLKKKLLFGPTSKKQELICTLRDTVKKGSNEIADLKCKLDILAKKNIALQGLMMNKEEEILFLNSKVSKMEQELQSVREWSQGQLQQLQQRVAVVLRSYQQLQIKLSRDEKEQSLLRSQWLQQKTMYLDRISFLEGVCRMAD